MGSHGEVWDVFYLRHLDSVVPHVGQDVGIVITILVEREQVDSGGEGIVKLMGELLLQLIRWKRGRIVRESQVGCLFTNVKDGEIRFHRSF